MTNLAARRDFIRTLLGGAAGLSFAGRALGQNTPASITATKLSDNLIEIVGAGANVVMVTAPDGVLMVDGGLPDRSTELLKVVSAQSGGRSVRVLFNTQWHLDHTGSNEALGKIGAKIIAHQNTKRWLSSQVFREAQNRRYEPRPPSAIPTETVTAPGTMMFGSEVVEYGPLPPAHTNGDLYLFFPGPNLLVASDVLTVRQYPNMDYSTGGWIGGMIDATTALLKIADANTRLVPGNGPLQTKNDLQIEHDMLVTVKDRVQKMIRQGKSLKEVRAEAPTKEFDVTWGSPDQFLATTYTGLVRHTHELGAIL